MKQQDLSQQLGSLIGATSKIYNTVPADEAIPSELQEPDPLFDINHKDEMSQCRTEALQTIQYIVKSVVPRDFISDDMIQNKMKIDAVQLGMLYYQQKMNNITLQTAMDVLSKGDTQPRMFEVIEKLQKRAAELSNQITEIQNQFRKYYIDSYLDIESRVRAEEFENNNKVLSNTVEQIEDKNQLKISQDGSVKTINSKQTVQEIQRLKIERAKAKMAAETEKNEEVKFQEA